MAHAQGQVTTERLSALLAGIGLEISKRQVVRLLTSRLDDLIAEDLGDGAVEDFKRILKIDPRNGRPVFLEKEAQRDPAAGQFDPDVRVNIRLTVGEQMRARLAHLAGFLHWDGDPYW